MAFGGFFEDDVKPWQVALSPTGSIFKQGEVNRRREEAARQYPNRDMGFDTISRNTSFQAEDELRGRDVDVGYIDPNDPNYNPNTGRIEAGYAQGGMPGFGGGGGYGSPAETAASYKQRALDYLMQINALPEELRADAMAKLGGVYGLKGGIGSQDDVIAQAIKSPLYQNIIGGREAGEEAIMRHASQTGGLRSGDIQSAFYDYNTQLENRALLESYNEQIQGLTGMIGLPSMAPSIAAVGSDIGETLAAGQVATQQAQAQEDQNFIQNLMGVGKLGLEAWSSGALTAMFSDRRLKTNVKEIGEINGLPWYSFTWNTVANKLGLKGETRGTMADLVFKDIPEAVFLKNGFMMVNYSLIGVM